MTQNDLTSLNSLEIRSCNPADLVDLRTIQIDRSLPVPRRIAAFIDDCKNPYLFKVGDVAVKVLFDPSGKTFHEAMTAVMDTYGLP